MEFIMLPKCENLFLKIHADDIGATRGVTNSILKGIDSGVLNSVSLIANLYDFDFAVEELKNRSHVAVSVHLNLLEGQSLAKIKNQNLVDTRGELNASFFKLLFLYQFYSKNKKKILKENIEQEIDAQILKVKDAFPESRSVGLDSHLYYHMIPFIFDICLRLYKKHNLSYLRTTNEIFVYDSFYSFIKSMFNMNYLKLLILRILNCSAKRKLKVNSFQTNSYYFGIQFSGEMRTRHIRKLLQKFKSYPGKNVIECVFHPGQSTIDENILLKNRPDLLKFYESTDREGELDEICSNQMKELVGRFN